MKSWESFIIRNVSIKQPHWKIQRKLSYQQTSHPLKPCLVYQINFVFFSKISKMIIQLFIYILNKLFHNFYWLIYPWCVVCVVIHYCVKEFREAVVSICFDLLVDVICAELLNKIVWSFIRIVLDLHIIKYK